MYRRTVCTIIEETMNEENEKSRTEGMPDLVSLTTRLMDLPGHGLHNRCSEKRFIALGNDVLLESGSVSCILALLCENGDRAAKICRYRG